MIRCLLRRSFLLVFLLLLGFRVAESALAAVTLPTLPQATVDTTYSAPTGATCTAANSAAFQTCLNNAALNSTIVLQAGTTYQGPFTLPNKTSGSGWIYIISSNYSSLPAPGNRVGLSDAVNMPKIKAAGGDNILSTADSAHHYRLVGIELAPLDGNNFVYEDFSIQGSTIAATPRYIIVDRCYIRANSAVVGPNASGNYGTGRRGVNISGNNVGVVDSYISGFREGADTQAIWVFNSDGPVKVDNNYLEGAGENFLIGGADVTGGTNRIPSDIVVTHNYVFKPLSWMGQSNTNVKNSIEFKMGRRILVEGNIFENNWEKSQNGFSFLITPRNQDGGNTWSKVSDITFRNNKMLNLSQGMNFSGSDSTYQSQRTERVLVENNLVLVSCISDLSGSSSGRGIQLIPDGNSGLPDSVKFNHNTFVHNNCGTQSYIIPAGGSTQFEYTNNIAYSGTYDLYGEGGTTGGSTLAAAFSTWTYANNVMYAGPGGVTYPANNYSVATIANVGFVDASGGNYRLSSSSSYKNAGTDGKDLGANIDALEAAIAGSGSAPDTTPPTSPTNLAASATSSSSVTVTWSASTDDTGVTSYTVQRCTGLPAACPDASFATVGTLTASPFVNNTGLSANTDYSYRVRASDAAGNTSGWTNVVSAKTQQLAVPAITSALTTSSAAGSAFSYQITASNNPTSYSATGLPLWASINTTTGIISGTPTTTGTTNITIGATNAVGTGTATFVLTVTAAPPVSFVQGAAFTDTTTASFSSNNTAGNTIIAAISWGNNATPTCSDSQGNTYTIATNTYDPTNNQSLGICYATNIKSGANTFTLNVGGAPFTRILIHEYSGIVSMNPVDVTKTNIADATTAANNVTSTTATTTQNNDLVFGAVMDDDGTTSITAGTNFTQRQSVNSKDLASQDQIQATVGSIASTQTFGAAHRYLAHMVAFKTSQTSSTSTSCNTITTTNFSQSTYNSYGAPFDAFQTSTNLMNAKCTGSDTHTINLTTGVTGDTTRIVYTKGYYYDPVTTGWTQYAGTCNGALNGEWCQGSVSATITSPNFSTASASNPTYLVGMTCSVQGGSWKCGCRDTTCANFYWQVQGAGQ